MKKYWAQIAKLPVRVEPNGDSYGHLNGVFLSPDTGQVIAYLVGILRVVVPVDVRKWGREQILISETEALVSPMEIHRLESSGLRKSFFNGKRVKSKTGANYGFVRDFYLDLTTNTLIKFEVSKKLLFFEWSKRQFQLRDIDHMTETSVIVTPEPEQKSRVKLKSPVPST